MGTRHLISSKFSVSNSLRQEIHTRLKPTLLGDIEVGVYTCRSDGAADTISTCRILDTGVTYLALCLTSCSGNDASSWHSLTRHSNGAIPDGIPPATDFRDSAVSAKFLTCRCQLTLSSLLGQLRIRSGSAISSIAITDRPPRAAHSRRLCRRPPWYPYLHLFALTFIS